MARRGAKATRRDQDTPSSAQAGERVGRVGVVVDDQLVVVAAAGGLRRQGSPDGAVQLLPAAGRRRATWRRGRAGRRRSRGRSATRSRTRAGPTERRRPRSAPSGRRSPTTTSYPSCSRRGWSVSAKPVSSGQSLWVTFLVGVLPTLLFIWFFVWLMRRSAAREGRRRAAGCSAMGRSKARKYEASAAAHDVRGRGRDRRGDRGAGGGGRLPQAAGPLPAARRQIPRGVLLSGPARARARRCSRGRWPARPTCRSTRSRRRSSWR